ncbi:shikimate kinase [Thalassotalea piscium]
MAMILVFGNSGSGKSTLAKKLAVEQSLAHLDLDTIAWENTLPPQRMAIEKSASLISDFTSEHKDWVIEGCYTDLLQLLSQQATDIIFLNLSITDCICNAKNRPWEPHKYPTKTAQDENLAMLVDWIAQYEMRTDTFSKSAHQAFYDNFIGQKKMYCSNV